MGSCLGSKRERWSLVHVLQPLPPILATAVVRSTQRHLGWAAAPLWAATSSTPASTHTFPSHIPPLPYNWRATQRADPGVLLTALGRYLPSLITSGADAAKLTGPFSKVGSVACV